MIKYIKLPKSDSSRIAINIEKDGQPFGQMWTWKDTKANQHPWHCRLLNGQYRNEWGIGISKAGALKEIKAWVESQA